MKLTIVFNVFFAYARLKYSGEDSLGPLALSLLRILVLLTIINPSDGDASEPSDRSA